VSYYPSHRPATKKNFKFTHPGPEKNRAWIALFCIIARRLHRQAIITQTSLLQKKQDPAKLADGFAVNQFYREIPKKTANPIQV
jgi:hypothetical protein